jgi:hypothetical protein
MASAKEVQLQKELNAEKQRSQQLEKLIGVERQSSLDLSYSLLETLKETLGIQTKSSQQDKDILKVNKEINRAIVDRSSSYTSISSLQKEIAKNEALATKGRNQSLNIERTLNDAQKKKVADAVAINREIADQVITLEKLENQQKNSVNLSEEEAKELQNKIESTKSLLGLNEEMQAVLMEDMSARERQVAVTKSQTEELEKQLVKQRQLQEGLGTAGDFADLIAAIPGLGGFAADALGEVTEELQASQDAGNGIPNAMQITTMMTDKLGAKIIEKLTNPMTALVFLTTQLVVAIKEADKQIGEFAKDLNISNDEANNLRQELDNIANASFSLFVNTQALGESLLAINKTLGTNVMLNERDLKTFTKLREIAGLTNEEIMGIQALSLATGKSLEQNTGEFLAQAQITSTQQGVLLNEKELLKGISDVSAATTLSFSKNPKLIADAVATAKSLGMELSKVEGIADSILDFESSIANELEAELLLGKNINLEKARQAALDNDLATLAVEIKKQAGSAEEFAKMNRIQQESIAKAVGMSREELAESLFVQEQLEGLTGAEAAKRERILNQRIAEVGIAQAQRELEEDGIDNLEQQANLGEKFGAIVDKIQDALTPLASLVLGVADALLIVLAPLQLINFIIGGIGQIFTTIGETIFGFIPALGIVGKLLKGIASLAVIFAAYKTFGAVSAGLAATGIGGLLAPVLSAAAAAAVASAGFGLLSGIKTGDAIIPASGQTQISTREGQLLSLSPNDDVIAAPGVASAVTGGGGGSSNKEVVSLLKTMVQQNAKKPEISPVGLYSVQ